MGSFGPELFDDDSACDALAHGISLEEPFPRFKEVFNYVKFVAFLDSDEGNEVLVFGFLLTCLKDPAKIQQLNNTQLPKPYRNSVDKFVNKHKAMWEEMPLAAKTELLGFARDACLKVLDTELSELYNLWSQASAEDFAQWKSNVDLIIKGLAL